MGEEAGSKGSISKAQELVSVAKVVSLLVPSKLSSMNSGSLNSRNLNDLLDKSPWLPLCGLLQHVFSHLSRSKCDALQIRVAVASKMSLSQSQR